MGQTMEAETQEAILAAAVDCFGRFGYRKTSVDQVAQQARVAKGTVYLYCEGKEDLFYQAVHCELRAWIDEISKRIDPRVPANKLILEVVSAYMAFVKRHPLVRDLMLSLLHGQLPRLADQLETLRALGRRHVVELLELGIRQGGFADDLDVEATPDVLHDLHFSHAV